MLQSVKCPRKKLRPVETQGFWWKSCQVGQNSWPEKWQKMKFFEKTKTHQLTILTGLTIAVQNEPITFVRKKCRRIAFYDQISKNCGFFQKSGHNFFPLCFTDFFPAKHLLPFGRATRSSTALKPLRPVCDELRDPKPEKHPSHTHFWPFSNYHKSTSKCRRAAFFSSFFLAVDVLSACSHL